MTHTTIQKRLILFLDGSLSEQETVAVKEHLSGCTACRHELQALSTVWSNENTAKKVTPPDFMWTKIEARLQSSTNKSTFEVFEKIIPTARFALITAVVLCAVIVGRYIGDVPTPVKSNDSGQYVWNAYNLDTFEPIPAESMGKVFTTVISVNRNEEKQ